MEKFSITVSEKKKVLVITYIGMKPQEVVSQPGKLLKVKMEDESQLLDEVVVVSVGYGNARKRDLTGAISSVGENTLKNIPVTSASSALTGRLAGVSVITSEGSPDASVSIRVRGGGSITQSNEPLFIVDGFEVSGIDDIPPTDIESIDVLKDASSTAIYGAKGANGVILVTTKSGRTGRTEVSFNASVGFSRMYNQTEVLSPYEYVCRQLRESFADYVFYHILRDMNTDATVTGLIQLKSSNKHVSPLQRQVSTWNTMVERNKQFVCWASSDECPFKVNVNKNLLTPINSFNL